MTPAPATVAGQPSRTPESDIPNKEYKVSKQEKQDKVEKPVEQVKPTMKDILAKIDETVETRPSLEVAYVVALVDAVKLIDGVISENAGTIGQIMAKAKNETMPASLPETVMSATIDTFAGVDNWEKLVKAVENLKVYVAAELDKAVVATAGETLTTRKATNSTLSAKREILVTRAHSMHTTLSTMSDAFPGIDKVVLPSKSGASAHTPKVNKTGESGGTPKGDGLAFYVVKADGSRYFYAKGSPLSLVANRAFKAAPVADVKAALESAGVNLSGPFEPVAVTVNEITASVGACAQDENPVK